MTGVVILPRLDVVSSTGGVSEKTYETTIQIDAPRESVWRVLTQEVPRDPAPFGILRLEGEIRPGARLMLWSEVAPDRAFALTVTEFDAPGRMVWRGGMPLGLFTGTRSFDLSQMTGGTQFAMREVFSGPLSPLIAKSIPDLTPSFEKFSQTLKEKAESQ